MAHFFPVRVNCCVDQQTRKVKKQVWALTVVYRWSWIEPFQKRAKQFTIVITCCCQFVNKMRNNIGYLILWGLHWIFFFFFQRQNTVKQKHKFALHSLNNGAVSLHATFHTFCMKMSHICRCCTWRRLSNNYKFGGFYHQPLHMWKCPWARHWTSTSSWWHLPWCACHHLENDLGQIFLFWCLGSY